MILSNYLYKTGRVYIVARETDQIKIAGAEN